MESVQNRQKIIEEIFQELVQILSQDRGREHTTEENEADGDFEIILDKTLEEKYSKTFANIGGEARRELREQLLTELTAKRDELLKAKACLEELIV